MTTGDGFGRHRSGEWSVDRRQRALVASCLAILGYQIVQAAMTTTVQDDFFDSYWLASYDEGFIRRGLGGEITKLLTGGQLDRSWAAGIQWAVTITLLGLLAWLVVRLLARGDACSRWLAVGFCAVPFGVDFLLTQRRPDQLAFCVVVAFALYLSRAERPRVLPAALAAGVVLAGTMFVHEGGAPVALPALVALLVVTRPKWCGGDQPPLRAYSGPMLAFFVPVVVVGAFVTLAGTLTPQEEVDIRVAAVVDGGISNTGALVYLDQSLFDGVRFVGSELPTILPGSLLLVPVVAAVVVFVFRPWMPTGAVTTVERRLIGIVTAGCFGFLFVTGKDWIRWSCWFGLSVGVVVAAAALTSVRDRDDGEPPADEGTGPDEGPRTFRRIAVGAALAYLVVLPPLPAAMSSSEAMEILFTVGSRIGG